MIPPSCKTVRPRRRTPGASHASGLDYIASNDIMISKIINWKGRGSGRGLI
jgi:hypothetical protein